jgi:hypothetical protein
MEHEDLYIVLYSESGRREQHNLEEFFPAPDDPLALKWNDDDEPARWVTTIRDLEQLREKAAPLSYTLTGLAALGFGPSDLPDVLQSASTEDSEPSGPCPFPPSTGGASGEDATEPPLDPYSSQL